MDRIHLLIKNINKMEQNKFNEDDEVIFAKLHGDPIDKWIEGYIGQVMVGGMYLIMTKNPPNMYTKPESEIALRTVTPQNPESTQHKFQSGSIVNYGTLVCRVVGLGYVGVVGEGSNLTNKKVGWHYTLETIDGVTEISRLVHESELILAPFTPSGKVEPTPIAAGDIVWLKSGGPAMTAGVIDGILCACSWFYNGSYGEAMMPLHSLTKVAPKEKNRSYMPNKD